MSRYILGLLLIISFQSCMDSEPGAQEIIDRSIAFHGGKNYDSYKMVFDFRGRHYISKRKNGNFEYTRISKDSTGQIVDSYSNSSRLERTRDGISEEVPDSLSIKIMNSINSVNYFVLLPYGLNDAAVNKKLINEVTLKGEPYFKIQVTFDQEDGGTDFEDIFLYWIHKTTFSMDYLAYQYFTDGGGLRFREAFNTRVINGLRFSDYRNYKPADKGVELVELDELFEADKLQLLSVIETENITVD